MDLAFFCHQSLATVHQFLAYCVKLFISQTLLRSTSLNSLWRVLETTFAVSFSSNSLPYPLLPMPTSRGASSSSSLNYFVFSVSTNFLFLSFFCHLIHPFYSKHLLVAPLSTVSNFHLSVFSCTPGFTSICLQCYLPPVLFVSNAICLKCYLSAHTNSITFITQTL